MDGDFEDEENDNVETIRMLPHMKPIGIPSVKHVVKKQDHKKMK